MWCSRFAELKERELGPHHLDVARALNNLAVMYSMQVRSPACYHPSVSFISAKFCACIYIYIYIYNHTIQF